MAVAGLAQSRVRDAYEVVARAVSAAWRPGETLPPDVWADRHRQLIAQAAAEPGPWRTDRAPHTRAVMRSYADPTCRRISLMMGAQVAKTECMYNCLFWTIDTEPRPTLFTYPTQDSAEDVSQERFTPSLLATRKVAERIRGGLDAEGKASSRALKTRKIQFDRMPLWFAWANSTISTKGKPVGRAFSDEIEEFPPGAVAHIDARLKTFSDRKHVLGSTPVLEGNGIHAEYLKGDQRHFEVPCPHCRRYQELIWAQVKWLGGGSADAQKVKLATWYECGHCRGKIVHAQLPAMLLLGRWIREGEYIDAAGQTSGAPNVPETDHHSYRLNTLYSPFYAWGELAATWCELQGEPTMEWMNNFGEPWRPKGQRAEAEDLQRLAVKVRDGGYARGEVVGPGAGPDAGVLAITASVDVQRERAYVEVLGWGERGRDTWLVDWLEVPIKPDGSEDLPELDFLRTAKYARRIGGRQLPIVRSIIDTGHHTRRVETWCRRHGIWAVPAKGEDARHMLTDWKVSRISTWPDGRPMEGAEGGLLLLLVNTWRYKEAVLGRLRGGPSSGWHFPEATPLQYFEGLTSEEFGPHPRTKRECWMLRPGRRFNHPLDCRVYHLALGDYMQVHTLTAAGLEAAIRKSAAAGPAAPAPPNAPRPTGAAPAAPAPSTPEPDDDETESPQRQERKNFGGRARGEWRPSFREDW